ncbi:MAG: sugar phosphate isomerase/epimerase [Alphaproteobacteria bacterium]|nr:sugar phosphate isomerase/epimerase [Alphaproteobacteria bacterium]
MKLSLSVRIAESPKRKDVAAVPIDVLAPRAAALGIDGLSMRASVVSVDSPPERVAGVKRLLDRHGLAVSLVTGDVALAANTADATTALRNITPYLDLAEALGSRLIRVMAHDVEDVGRMRRAADMAAERGLAIAHQTHWGTLCETVDLALDVVAAVGRENFGVTFDPANIMACGGDYGPDAVRRLAPHLFNVFFQNVRLDPGSPIAFPSRRMGVVGVRYVPLDDAGGVDVLPIVETLRAVGYDGWFTVHQPLREGQSVDDAMAEAAGFFRPLIV